MNMKYHCTQIGAASNSAPSKTAVITLFALTCMVWPLNTQADNQLHQYNTNQQPATFTFNSKQTTAIPERKAYIPQLISSSQFSLQSQLALENDIHLEFNYLWMRQSQDHYRYSDGGAALGRLFRMGVKTWYKNYRDSNRNVNLPNENGGGAISHDIDYRLRLSSDRVKLALEYEF